MPDAYRRKEDGRVLLAVRWDGRLQTAFDLGDFEFSVEDYTRRLFIPTGDGAERTIPVGHWLTRDLAVEEYDAVAPGRFQAEYEPA